MNLKPAHKGENNTCRHCPVFLYCWHIPRHTYHAATELLLPWSNVTVCFSSSNCSIWFKLMWSKKHHCLSMFWVILDKSTHTSHLTERSLGDWQTWYNQDMSEFAERKMWYTRNRARNLKFFYNSISFQLAVLWFDHKTIPALDQHYYPG